MNKMAQYSYLRPVLSEFLQVKIRQNKAAKALQEASEYVRLPRSGENRRHLFEQLGITTEEFYEKFLMPWSNLTSEQVREVVHHWNMVNAPEMHLLMEVTPTYENLAIHWTLVNICKLNLLHVFLPEYENELPDQYPRDIDWLSYQYGGPAYALPYKQCCYCGRLEKDPRGQLFGKQDLFYCHVSTCPSSDPNPSSHPEACCYGAWQRQKANLRKKLQRYEQNPEKVTALFLAFCEQRYLANQNLRIRVQVQKEKPYDWIRYSDYLGFSVYRESKY